MKKPTLHILASALCLVPLMALLPGAWAREESSSTPWELLLVWDPTLLPETEIGAQPVSAPDFARLCALSPGEPEEKFAAIAGNGAWIDRQTAAMTAASAVYGPLRNLLTFSDAALILPQAVNSVEQLCHYGILDADEMEFRPGSALTWTEAAGLLARLSQPERRAVQEPAVINCLGFSNDPSPLTSEQRQLMLDLTLNYHRGRADLTAVDFSPLFDPASPDGEDLERTALDLLRAQRGYSPIDLTMSAVTYSLELLSVESLKDDRIEVHATEYCAMAFRGTQEVVSEEPWAKHTFLLSQTPEGWRIWSHLRDDSGYGLLADAKDRSAECRTLLALTKASMRTRTAQLGFPAPSLYADHPYIRDNAVAYARAYANTRNNSYLDYSNSGGNCQNYASQCLAAGGIPHDLAGDHHWYPDSRAWVSVNKFKAYAQSNTGFGLAALWGAPFYSGEPGALVHVGTGDGVRHAMVITGVIRDEGGQVVDYLVCSNTCNWRDMPLSAHWYDHQELIKIAGWND